MPNVGFKLFFGLVFGSVYVLYYQGGDTIAYWESATKLNNLFLKSPALYIEELFSKPEKLGYLIRFDADTGYPPGWIYREPESWFVAKIASIVNLITFKSYWAGTLIISYVTALSSWKLFNLISKLKILRENYLAIGLLFIPSVSFWCSGISKDSIVLVLILLLIYNIFTILSIEFKSSLKNWAGIAFFSFLLFNIRSIILMAVFAPLIFSVGSRISRKYKRNKFTSNSILILSNLFGFLFVILAINYNQDYLNNIVQEASVIQQDFLTNELYQSNKYSLEISEVNTSGLITALPASIFAGIYRPLPWESLSPTLILNGLESTYFIFLTIQFFFKGKFLNNFRNIFKHEFLIYCLFFALIIALISGFTGIIFGVLVRFRAPALPFFFLILTSCFLPVMNKKRENNT